MLKLCQCQYTNVKVCIYIIVHYVHGYKMYAVLFLSSSFHKYINDVVFHLRMARRGRNM
jgi:hypothetical protein